MIRSSSLDASLAGDIGIVSINKIAEFSRYINEFDPLLPTKRLCAFRGAQEGDNRIAVKLTANGKELTAVLDSGSTVPTST
jgi:superfamily II helicase